MCLLQTLLFAWMLVDDPSQETALVPEGPSPPQNSSSPLPSSPGNQRSQQLQDLNLIRQADESYLYIHPSKQFSAQFMPNGTVRFADRWKRPSPKNREHGKCCAVPLTGFPLLGGEVTGPTEWVMAIIGDDPNARAKAELLNKTRDLRTQMAIAWNLNLLATRLKQLEQELFAVWQRTELSPAQRRNLLFELWDDCDEKFQLDTGEVPSQALSTIDSARIKTAETARRTIEDFIRRQLPKQHRHRYRTEELADMNARRISVQPFAPYNE